MPRVQRPPIQADIGAETVRHDESLRCVMTLLAKALQRAEPEFVGVAMRLNVIADCRRVTMPRSAQYLHSGCTYTADVRVAGAFGCEPSEPWSTTYPISSVGRGRPWLSSIPQPPRRASSLAKGPPFYYL